jgi:uncharacterized protein (DUF3084 family)
MNQQIIKTSVFLNNLRKKTNDELNVPNPLELFAKEEELDIKEKLLKEKLIEIEQREKILKQNEKQLEVREKEVEQKLNIIQEKSKNIIQNNLLPKVAEKMH